MGWRGAKIAPSGWGALLIIIAGSFFTIDALAHLNKVLLPEAPWVENLKAQEATVKLALDILLSNMVPTTLLANALIMVVVPAVGEELFFRGDRPEFAGTAIQPPPGDREYWHQP